MIPPMAFGMEQARQNAIAMRKLEEYAKEHTPKGMVYKGLKGEPFQDKTNYPDTQYQWTTMGIRFKPVHEKEE